MNKTPTVPSRRRGFILLEALAASVITAVALGSVLDVIIEGRRMMQDATRRAAAMRVAQDYTEERRNVDYDALTGVSRAAVPGRPGIEAQVQVQTRSVSNGGFTYSFKEVTTSVFFVYRRQNTRVDVVLVRSP